MFTVFEFLAAVMFLAAAALFNGLLIMLAWRMVTGRFGGFRIGFWLSWGIGLVFGLVGSVWFDPWTPLLFGVAMGCLDAALVRLL